MQLANAQQAGVLAGQIADLQKTIDQLQNALTQGLVISKLNAESDRFEYQLLAGNLDAATSQQMINVALTFYQAQLTALNAQLAAM